MEQWIMELEQWNNGIMEKLNNRTMSNVKM